jgi:glyoxylase-like metal-dependent hydrolase (beta-lactamase superfamily II)
LQRGIVQRGIVQDGIAQGGIVRSGTVSVRMILPSLYAVRLGVVHVFVIEDGQDLILIDTGYRHHAAAILRAVDQIGGAHKKLRHVVVTHCHPDHSGSLAEIKRRTGARACLHAADAAMVRVGETRRPWKATPGLLNWVVFQAFIRHAPRRIEPADVEVEVKDGDRFPWAGGVQAIHVPGHCAGQIALLWQRHGGVLFVGDAASNLPHLRLSFVHEDLETGLASLRKLAALRFEHVCFGHGRPILGGADERFARRFARGASSVPDVVELDTRRFTPRVLL